MTYHIVRADPAGNITLFVLDPVEKAQRAPLSAQLMAMPEWKAEQVAFVCEDAPGCDGHMEMMGGEFCGNATRAFGMLTAQRKGLRGRHSLIIAASGCDRPVAVDVDAESGTARAEMPLPLFARAGQVDGVNGTLVHLGGIAHFVVDGVAPSREFFDRAEPLFQTLEGLDAYGVIFLSGGGRMTPLVKVPATGTLVWEGSCGSGSLAAAIAQSADAPDGEFARDYIQPAGTVRATVVRAGGRVVRTFIGGPVTLDAPVTVTL